MVKFKAGQLKGKLDFDCGGQTGMLITREMAFHMRIRFCQQVEGR
jgi:hypothetical protein